MSCQKTIPRKFISLQKLNFSKDENSMLLRSALCGFLAGDGSVQVRKVKTYYHYQLDFFPDDKFMMKTYYDYMKIIYNRVPSTRIRDNVYHVRITSRAIVEDLLEHSQFGIKEWSMPEELFSIEGAKEAWLRAFYSAEAYINDNVIRIQTVNKNGMLAISKLLLSLGIENRVYYYQPKKQNWSLVTIVTINKKEARRIFFDKVGFWHSKKTKTLKKSLNL
jgi:hypothetical protein